MRVYEETERHIIWEEGDELPPEIMTHWGNQKKRKRMQPTSLVIKWLRRDGSDWELREVYLFGNQVHKTNSNSFIHHLFQRRGPVWAEASAHEVAADIPEYAWMHIAQSHPQFDHIMNGALADLKYILGIK